MNTVAEAFGIPKKLGFLIGCEFEIEGINHHDGTYLANHNIQMTEDPSLRTYEGRAWEFITKPIGPDAAIAIHDQLYNKGRLEFCGKPDGDRCSIHVHVNFSSQTCAKTHQFILLYALLEPLFFDMVDESRQNNIYCVPLGFTSLSKYYPNTNLNSMVDKWSKYTAFNILPLGKQGSIEFRHLQGTKDNTVFKNWVTAIHNLYKFNENNELKSETLTPMWAYMAAQSVFGAFMTLPSSLDKKLEHTYLDVKLALLDPDKDMVVQRIKAANLEISN